MTHMVAIDNDSHPFFLLAGHKLTVDQFLNHLPKNVVKEGKVINIRNHVAEALKVE